MKLLKMFGLLALAAMALTALIAAPSATAAFGLKEADVRYEDENGDPVTLAGAHPFQMTTRLIFNTTTDGSTESPDGALKDLTAELPEGLAGIPAATARCSAEDFTTLDRSVEPYLPSCSDDSVVGYITAAASFNPFAVGNLEFGSGALYNLAPPPGAVAKFGFYVVEVPVTIEVRLSQEAPYHVEALARNVAQPLLLYGTELHLWGYPADPAHDPFRGSCFNGTEPDGSPISKGTECPVSPEAPHLPLITLPRSCQGPQATLFSAASWQEPGVFVEKASESALEVTDCESLGLDSSIEVAPTTTEASSPSGLDFAVEVDDPGITDPDLRAGSDIKRLEVRMPAGLTLNPSSADGLATCSEEQYNAEALASEPGDNCPEASKVATATVQSPLVDEPLKGSIFVATPEENPFGTFLATYLVLRNKALGVIVKQAGPLQADPATGQLTATFDDVPQLPFGRLEAHFRSGARAPLSTPPACGDYTATALEVPWANPEDLLSVSGSFAITGACRASDPGPFAPTFTASTASSAAGTYSPLTMRLTRQDFEAELARLQIELPKGLTGKVAGVGRCTEAQFASAQAKTGRQEIADPSCPTSSQIGRLEAGAGVGGSLTWVDGKIYLSGPAEGDPFSVIVIVPAVAGPFDAGNIALRLPLAIDPTTAQVKIDAAKAPEVPRVLKGIPARLADLRLYIDRENFTLNASGCDQRPIKAKATGKGPALPGGATTTADLSFPYAADNCKGLGFKPKLRISLKGSTKRTGHPALKAVLTPRAGDSNLGRAAVVLPPSQFIDQAHISNPCTRVQFEAHACPKGSVLGTARAVSPILDQPLEGPVYFRSNGGERDLPDVVADLNGEAHVVLVGFVDSVARKGTEISRTRTTFQSTPDAPITKFTMSLFGGKRGLLQNSRNLCKAAQKADVKLGAQNGRKLDFKLKIQTSCKKQGGKGRGAKRR